MSHLEGVAKPTLIRLIDNPYELSKLSPEERFVVARWTLKTVIALNGASFGNPDNPLDRPVPSEHARVLMEGGVPDGAVVFAGGCPSDRVSEFIQNASWGVPNFSAPLEDKDRQSSYKIGVSFRSLCLGAAYYPNTDYCYGIPRRTHVLLHCRGRDIVQANDDLVEVPVVANAPILERFLANVFLVSKARRDMIENETTTKFIVTPSSQ
jgi:hypothetical protein